MLMKGKSVSALVAAGTLCLGLVVVPLTPAVQSAHAITYSDLANARSSKASSAAREAQLREQLSGVKSDLADQIVELDDITNNQIPAAQKKVTAANEAAAAAQSEADAAAQRLAAARKDAESLQKSIAQTGVDYDDAKAAVAQMARQDMHGSDASDVMSIVTGSTSTTEFISSMQSKDALSRNESNAANDAASTLSTSMNRAQRLAAIEKRVAELKATADSKAESAKTAASEASSERSKLDKLRQQGEEARDRLQSQQSQISSAVAAQAAKTVMLESQLDSYNRQYAAQQAAAAAQVDNGRQGSTDSGSSNGGSSGGGSSNGGSSGGGSSSGGSSSDQGASNGDVGNAYPWGQCTYWAYVHRHEMGISTPSYLGNGGEWWANASKYGLRADHTPQVGAAISFLPGQLGADGTYGHVAVVESVSGSTITISEMNAKGLGVVSYRTVYNASQYWYVH